MRVKPEHLKLANRVAGIKETTSTAARRNYWNGVHRLFVDREAGCLVLKTNDGSMWLEWKIPYEGDPIDMDVLIPERQFDSAARYLEGGSLEVVRHNRIVTLEKDQLRYRMKEETTQPYPEPDLGTNPVTWRTVSAHLAKALKFVGSFIDEANPSKHKSVATLYTNGRLIGGNPKRIAAVKGLQAEADMSFKTRTAKVVAEFLSCIGDNVEITVSDRCYQFKDPDAGHTLIVLSDEGRFPSVERDLTHLIQEVDQVDRKTLLQRAKAFAGTMQEGAERLNLSFRGQGDTASLHVYTPGNDPNEVTEDEFAVYREFSETADRTTEVGAPLDVGVNRDFLSGALDAMEGTTVKFKYCGRMLLVEDEVPDVEEGETRGPERSILITVQQTRGDEAETEQEEAPRQTQAAAAVPPEPEEEDEEEDDLENEETEDEEATAARD